MKKIFLTIALFTTLQANVFADISYFIDFDKVLNFSKAGKSAQDNLKKKFNDATKKFKDKEDQIRKEEAKIISQKKIITAEEYQKQVELLRKKVTKFQKEKQASLNSVAKSRNDAKQALLKAVNPIIKKYMEEKNIRLIIDKKVIVLGDKTLEITDQVIDILNKELPSLN